jgi:hypothetical protein
LGTVAATVLSVLAASNMALETVMANGVDPTALLPPATGVVGAGGASGTSLPVTGVSGKIQMGMTVSGPGVPAGTTILAQTAGTTPGGAGTYRTSVATTSAALDALTFTAGPSLAFFPAFAPIVPPPPIGADKAVPNFPPPTPPPIGSVPIGDLVGPVVAAAGVPPSVAGFAQPQYKTGSATSPTAASWFPQFTTIFPNPTIVFTNTLMIGAAVPPQTASTQNIQVDGWGPSVPPGAPTAPGGDGRFPRVLEDETTWEAWVWLSANPNDPRAPDVRAQLGA